MRRYKITFCAYQDIEVMADGREEAIALAKDEIHPRDWEDPEVDNVYPWDEEDNIDLDGIPTVTECCYTCAHCTAIDDDTHLATCSIDQVPNGHKSGHCCSLYDEKGGIQ